MGMAKKGAPKGEQVSVIPRLQDKRSGSKNICPSYQAVQPLTDQLRSSIVRTLKIFYGKDIFEMCSR